MLIANKAPFYLLISLLSNLAVRADFTITTNPFALSSLSGWELANQLQYDKGSYARWALFISQMEKISWIGSLIKPNFPIKQVACMACQNMGGGGTNRIMFRSGRNEEGKEDFAICMVEGLGTEPGKPAEFAVFKSTRPDKPERKQRLTISMCACNKGHVMTCIRKQPKDGVDLDGEFKYYDFESIQGDGDLLPCAEVGGEYPTCFSAPS